MTAHDLTTDRARDPAPRRGLSPIAIVLLGVLMLMWAGLVAGAAFALAPSQAATDIAVGLGWTVVISALAGVAVSAIYSLVFAPDRGSDPG